MTTIKKSKTYKVGICSIRGIVGDLEKKIEFDQGKEIKVTKDQLDKINEFGWCEIVEKPKVKGKKDG